MPDSPLLTAEGFTNSVTTSLTSVRSEADRVWETSA
jgi:hypothetical protein